MATPKLFDEWMDAMDVEYCASVEFTFDENMDAWNAASQDEQDAYDRWRDYADEHELCVTCAGPAGSDGWVCCAEHRD